MTNHIKEWKGQRVPIKERDQESKDDLANSVKWLLKRDTCLVTIVEITSSRK